MSKIKILYIALVALLVMNIFLLSVLFFAGPKKMGPYGPPKDGDRAEMLLVDRLKLTDSQVDEFRRLKNEHREKLDIVNKKLGEGQKALFDLLQNESIDSVSKENILNEIATATNQINELHLKHFSDLKNMGTEEQKELFNEFIGEMSHRFVAPKGPHDRKPGPPRKRGKRN